ncbi:hypothetical protein BASA81_005427 [Batrachochytrium salamandrivorans]|nr:hypothetical protein BASA81_005427 [Batrachochytrium salamandrivorans]
MLALPWRLFDSSEEGLQINNHTLKVVQQANSPDGSGLTVWDCAFVLAKYLEKQAPGLVEGKSVLELGAGTGLVGLAAHFLGAKQVVGASHALVHKLTHAAQCLTDLKYALGNLNSNVVANCAQDGVFCQELDWTKPQDYRKVLRGMLPDVVLMSDIIWLADQAPALVGQLVELCQQFAPETLSFV